MADHVILGIHITTRMTQAVRIQQLFSEYGCFIKTRLGLHEASEGVCSPGGVVLLEMVGGVEKAKELEKQLAEIDGVFVQKMIFNHS